MMATITCAKTGYKTYLIIYNSVVTNNLLRMTLTMFSHDDQTFMIRHQTVKYLVNSTIESRDGITPVATPVNMLMF